MDVFTYDSLESCIAAFYNCGTAEIHSKGPWEWEQDGRMSVWGMRRMIRCRKKYGTWGFCNNKKSIHIWVAKHAEPVRIIRLLSHEIGHMQKPFKRDNFAEERKAGIFESVAVSAFEIMEEIMENKQ